MSYLHRTYITCHTFTAHISHVIPSPHIYHMSYLCGAYKYMCADNDTQFQFESTQIKTYLSGHCF